MLRGTDGTLLAGPTRLCEMDPQNAADLNNTVGKKNCKLDVGEVTDMLTYEPAGEAFAMISGMRDSDTMRTDDHSWGLVTKVKLPTALDVTGSVPSINGHIWTRRFSICSEGPWGTGPGKHCNTNVILNECWGLSKVLGKGSPPVDQILVSCGAGIEGCEGYTGNDLSDCQKGLADRRACPVEGQPEGAGSKWLV